MAIKFQYNKTSLQQLEKQLKMRERSLPTIKSKESALRIEVKRTKDEVNKLELQLEREIQSYENMVALWKVQSGADLREGRYALHEEDRRRDRPVIGRDQVRDRTL